MATIKNSGALERRLAEFSRKVSKAAHLRVGFLSNATYPDGTPVAMVAAIQNFGAPAAGIPPRPFFSNMVKDDSPNWGDNVATALKAKDFDATEALKLVGNDIAGKLRQSIIDTNEPPLKPATIRRKGFDKALIDTSTMINSVDYEVD